MNTEYWPRKMEKLFETMRLDGSLKVNFVTNLLIWEVDRWPMVTVPALGVNQAVS